jgi:hypothetical protein
MGRASMFVALCVLAVAVVVFGATRKVDFSDSTVGQAPKGFEFGHTAKAGAPGKWIVQSEGGNKFLVQVDADNTRARFPVAVVSDISAADVDLSVRFKPVSGRVDQAAGLVWRFQNEDNYYIVRANALEDNVVLYKTVNGVRSALDIVGRKGGYGVGAAVPANQWHALRVDFGGSRFRVLYNGKQLFEVEDSTFSDAGKVGLWTKADSVTLFDEINYGETK